MKDKRNLVRWRPLEYRVAIGFVVLALTLASSKASAQTYNVIHNFTGAGDGANPYAGLTMDRSGNLYGTASAGGPNCISDGGCGTVFQLTNRNHQWFFSTIYGFAGSDGAAPIARVVFGPGGALYGTTEGGGANFDGTVFKLTQPVSICREVACSWSETLLYSFTGNPSLWFPNSEVVFDAAGNLYGTTLQAGNFFACANDRTCGAAYELSLSQGQWGLSRTYIFQGSSDGAFPYSVILGSDGDLYGTTAFRGNNTWGTVFKLIPSGSTFGERTLYSFSGGADGGAPLGGVIFDPSGNLLGTTSFGGSGGGGTAFKLSPSNGSWTLDTLYSFVGGQPDVGPAASLVRDTAGNLYGTTSTAGAHHQGSVFKLTPSGSGYSYTSLHDFTGGTDGGQPRSQVILDASGNVYGTTSIGGNSVGKCNQGSGCGVVFEITP